MTINFGTTSNSWTGGNGETGDVTFSSDTPNTEMQRYFGPSAQTGYNTSKIVQDALTAAATRAGNPDYDFSGAVVAASNGAPSGGHGWQAGVNPFTIVNAVLSATGDPAMTSQVLDPSSAQYQAGNKVSQVNEQIDQDSHKNDGTTWGEVLQGIAFAWGVPFLASLALPALANLGTMGAAGAGEALTGAAASGTPDAFLAGGSTALGGSTAASAGAATTASELANLGTAGAGVGAGGSTAVGLDTVGGVAGAGGATGAAGTAGATGAAATGGAAGATGAAGTVAKVIGGLKTAQGLVSGVLGANSLLGDPLGLNKGADAANTAATNASNASADAQRTLANISQEQWNYYKTNYQPLETNLIKQAQDAGSPEEFARARASANANVTGAFDTARKQTRAGLESMGVNPGSGAFQSADASTNIAQAGAQAGAATMADQNTRNLAYSKALDVTGIGRNIPAQSAAASGAAANTANQAASVAGQRQNTLNTQGVANTGAAAVTAGVGLDSLSKLFSPGPTGSSQSVINSNFGTTGGTPSYSTTPAGYMNDPTGNIVKAPDDMGFIPKFAKGGQVIDARKVGLDTFDATPVAETLKRKGLHPNVAHAQAHGAAKRYLTPHMKVFASGGGVGTQADGNAGPDLSNMGKIQGPGTGTSDSIPAAIDGQQPAALSNGEFVMSAEVPKLSGEEILEAINQAGLKKRQGLESNTAPQNAPPAYARGGRVNHASWGL